MIFTQFLRGCKKRFFVLKLYIGKRKRVICVVYRECVKEASFNHLFTQAINFTSKKLFSDFFSYFSGEVILGIFLDEKKKISMRSFFLKKKLIKK
jgi:hypothetical protein